MASRMSGVAPITLTLTLCLIIAGCASTGGIHPQAQITQPASLDPGKALADANADAHWPDSDWWRAYRDPQLDTWIDSALAGSPTLAIAQARVRAAESLAGVAQSALAPQVNANVQIQGKHWPDNVYYGPGSLNNQTTWNNTAALGLSYHLDVWGRDRNAAERALDTAHARAADARTAQLELESNIVRAYVDLALNYALRDIADDTLRQQQQIADLAHKRFDGGIGTQLEVSQAETPIPEYQRQIDVIDESIALDRNQIAALAGKGPGAGEALTRPQLSLAAPAGLPASLPADLIGHRPDLVAARWSVAGAARGIDVAKADFYPNIDLLASFGTYAAMGPLSQFLHAQSQGWTAGPALSLPVFDGGRLRAQLGDASANYDAAVEQYNQTLVGALKDVADQVVRLRSLDTQKEAATRSVDAAQRNYALAREGYRRGITEYLNVPVAQTQLLRAQEGVAKVDAARLAAHASLVAALGGGLAEPSDAPANAQLQPGAKAAHQPAATSLATPSATSSATPSSTSSANDRTTVAHAAPVAE